MEVGNQGSRDGGIQAEALKDDENTSKHDELVLLTNGANSFVYEVADKAADFAALHCKNAVYDYEDTDFDHVEEVEANIRRIPRLPDLEHLRPINPKELREYTARMNSEMPTTSSPGDSLQHFQRDGYLHQFPPTWKTALVVMIKKPCKSCTIPQTYRTISLLPTLGKL